jgi:hypothetical protein
MISCQKSEGLAMNQRLFGKVLLVAAMIAMAAVFTVRAESARADTIYTITQNGIETPITPLTGTDSASAFFNYYNSSSHTGHELADKSVLFLYEDTVTNNVSLVIIHDAITGDPDGGSATWTIDGLPAGGTVLVSDDPGEFINGTGANVGKAFGTWNWLSAYTDGGVIYLLDDPAISTIPLNVTIDGTFNDGISEWVLFAGQGIDVPLEMTPGTPFETVTLTSTGIDSDADGDGYHTVVIPGATEGIDCDDGNAAVNPGATEIAYNGIDDDCSGGDLTDVDNDGYDGGLGGSDCDDGNAAINPGATEIPYNGVDEDCSGGDLIDFDNDGYDGGLGGSDCDDGNSAINPGPTEIPYNGIDEDCSGGDLTDFDNDGYDGGPGGSDCDDGNSAINPGATEIHGDAIDNDCDGDIDEVSNVEIDVKPGSDVNPLNLNGNGVVPIAILGSASMEVTQIDALTVTAGATGTEASPVHGGHIEDVNGDGIADIVFHFREGDLEITGSTKQDVSLFLNAIRTDGEPVAGEDDVRINPNNGKSKGKGGKGPK